MNPATWKLLVEIAATRFGTSTIKALSPIRTRKAADARSAAYIIARSQIRNERGNPPTDGEIARASGKKRCTVCKGRQRGIDLFEVDKLFRERTQEALREFVRRRHEIE